MNLQPCPHCATCGLGANALAAHIERRHTGPPAPYAVILPGEPRATIVYPGK